MIILSTFFALLITPPARAESCELQSNQKLNCEIEWTSSNHKFSFQLYTTEQGCEFPEDEKNTCARVRLCSNGQETESGASVIMQPNASNSYCETKKPVDLFSGSNKETKAFVVCQKKRPKQIRLEANGKKKLCDLPLWVESAPTKEKAEK